MAGILQGFATNRTRALLVAVAAGRAELTLSCEPDLRIDGLLCCDQENAHELSHDGLIHPTRPGRIGSWVPAELTQAGAALLSDLYRDAA